VIVIIFTQPGQYRIRIISAHVALWSGFDNSDAAVSLELFYAILVLLVTSTDTLLSLLHMI